MPLTLAGTGTENVVKKVKGKDEVRRFLAGLGLAEGGRVTVISRAGGNLIVSVKGARVAISSSMANRILV